APSEWGSSPGTKERKMADLEDVTLDGRPLQSLRVADLKAALEERGLSKSGQKNTLIKRLKGALMLENLQRTSTPHIGLQPNSHIGEEMSQNSFIKQYLAKQQELLRQRLEREAREAYETNVCINRITQLSLNYVYCMIMMYISTQSQKTVIAVDLQYICSSHVLLRCIVQFTFCNVLPGSKSSPGAGSAEGDQESAAVAGRKRRWGSSTAVTAKKPSISITTDSLKSLIPDIKPCLGQEAVVDLHPEETVLSGAEDEDRERSDQDLQIRRTVTQVVPLENQENGQKEAKRSRHEECYELFFITPVTPSDTLIRRSISQQKTGVSITIDDPVRTARQPSPPRGKVSAIVHVCNLVRPFTLGQLKELLSRTGTLVEEGFWIDKIKSHCYVTYSSIEEAVATRAALHGVKWPQSNPKVLSVDFCQQDELDFHKGLGAADRPGAEDQGPGSGRGRTLGLPSLLPERDQWAEREREMERRERARAEREWDRDKVREFGKPGEEKEGGPRRSRSRERRRKERGKSKEKKTEKKEKAAEDPPAKLLDDLFRKTKAAPCIYWLPLTEEQFLQREAARAERMKEREKRRKEQEEEEERKERMKAAGGTTGDRSEGEKDKDRDRERDRDRGRDRHRDRERERERERENDKRRDGYRRPGGSGAGGGRRSRSRSEPRERRR
uniref:SAP domain-containing protein n=1 Tax=Amphiprion ocellaris TaxID=80972 RepID=A0AAQ6A691_AMPOC